MLRIIFFYLFIFVSMQADEIKSAYLELIQQKQNTYVLLLKLPTKEGKIPSIKVKDIQSCKEKGSSIRSFANDSYMDRITLECTQSLRGKEIEIQGLEDTKINVLLRLIFLDNSSQTTQLNSLYNTYTIQENASSVQIMQTYSWLGITHILMGFDHLLFVFALLLIVKNMRRLLWTITAFTLAHSITMVGATLGFMSMPQQPVEAIIALSILFLAMEIIHEKQGKVGLTSRYPWIIAFIFGLLHGFGFAGALSDIGLPQQAITSALIFFNIGVEVGQLLFVATVVIIALLLKRLGYPNLMEKLEIFFVYAIGGLSAFWVFERILSFL